MAIGSLSRLARRHIEEEAAPVFKRPLTEEGADRIADLLPPEFPGSKEVKRARDKVRRVKAAVERAKRIRDILRRRFERRERR